MKLRSDSHKITQVFDPETGIAMDIKIYFHDKHANQRSWQIQVQVASAP